ncbi:Arm DNA-binding domain-containing protein, partial [Thiomonas sp.]|uniref:tyrosine-type recombinase/integrase n=1 Tax=Thiomonas sp. TaxID=2047785 RepID=UPI002590C251
MALTLAQIKAAKSSDKPMKLSDEHGMYLFVNQSGKYWRFDYRFGGKRKTMSIGVFPAVGLAQARQALYEARALLSKGMDPMKRNGSTEAVMEEKSRNDFESVARDWIKNMEETWASEHESRVRRSLENWVFPWIGAKTASEIHAADLLSVA